MCLCWETKTGNVLDRNPVSTVDREQNSSRLLGSFIVSGGEGVTLELREKEEGGGDGKRWDSWGWEGKKLKRRFL